MQHCEICCHPERAAIEAAIRAGAPWQDLAARWNLCPVGLAWHAFAHLRGYDPAKPSAPLPPLVEPETPATPKVNPQEDAYWRAVQQAMARALKPFPAAFDAIREALIALDPALFEEPAPAGG
ncbi:MAG: hypothetical protein IPM24_25705 [Bryobacterales bacterium]|jgi:hypothetical protein|nr:hypothetical protein [Bryobacterales bacterium]